MGPGRINRNQLWTDLEAALANDEFYLLFQPVFDLAQEVPCGAEALLRWHHPTWDDLSPRIFIPAAETIGMTFSLGERVLHLLCQQGVDWILEGLPALRLSANISAGQLSGERTPETIKRILTMTGYPAANLLVEINEKDILTPGPNLETTLGALGNLGVQVAVDDFGSTVGSLTQLAHPALTMVKLAPNVLQNHDQHGHQKGFLQAITNYAEVRGLQVVAKGVENEEQLATAMEYGIHLVQGYSISRPLTSDRFSAWHRHLTLENEGVGVV